MAYLVSGRVRKMSPGSPYPTAVPNRCHPQCS